MASRATLDLNKVRVFVTVADKGSLTAAARELALPTSSVSRAITSLEGALGVRLLQRTPRSTQLTSAGASYYGQVRTAMQSIEQAQQQVRDDATAVSGLIRITASSVVAAGVLAPLIARFRLDNPGVTFDVLVTTAVVDLIAAKVDLALRMRRVTGPNLTARRLATLEPRLYAAPSYLALRGNPGAPGDLRGHDGVAFRGLISGDVWRLHSEHGAVREVKLRSVITCDDHLFLRQAVVEGCGIGIVPPYFADADVQAGRVVPVLPRYGLEPTPMWLVTPQAQAQPPARVVRFKRLLLEVFGHGDG